MTNVFVLGPKWLSGLWLCSALALTGCASLIDIHQHEPSLSKTDYSVTGRQALINSVTDARAQEAKYSKAASEYSMISNAAPIIIGAATLTSLLDGAAGGGNPRLFSVLGGTSAAAYGLSRLSDNQIRQMIWLNGAMAIDCAVASTEPLLSISDSSLNVHLQALSSALAALNRFSLSQRGYHPQRSNQEVAALKTAAAQDIAAAIRVEAAFSTAAVSLRRSAINIQFQVDKQLLTTNMDAAATMQFVSDLTSALPKLTPAGLNLNKNAQPADAPQADAVDQAADVVDQTRIILEADLLQPAQLEAIGTAMAQCRFAAAPTALAINPNETVHLAQPGDSFNYSVVGAKDKVRATILGTVDNDISATATQQAGNWTVAVTVTSDAQAQQVTLQISDSGGQQAKNILVTVAAKAPQDQLQHARNPPGAPAPQFSAQQLDVVRRVLKMPETGAAQLTADEQTALQNTYPSSKGKLTTTLYGVLYDQARVQAVSTPPNPFELGLIPGTVPDLNTQCGLHPVMPTKAAEQTDADYLKVEAAAYFSSAFRSAVMDAQNRGAALGLNLPINGIVDQATGTAIHAKKVTCKP